MCEQAHVEVGQEDRHEAAPGELHVALVEPARAHVGAFSHRSSGETIEEPSDEVREGVAAERVSAEEDDVEREHQGSDADSERLGARRGIEEARSLPGVVREDQKEEVVVRAGEVLVIPSNLPHKALALEDTLDVDIFCPPRQDWLDKTDAYLRGR